MLRNTSGDGVQLDSSRMELGELAPGAVKTVEFAFTVQPDLAADVANIELVVYDADIGAQSSEKLKFPVSTTGSAVTAAAGVVETKGASTDVREGASADATVIATAGKGTRWKVLGTVGPWTKVELDSGAPGFVASRAVSKSSGDLVLTIAAYHAGGGAVEKYGNQVPPYPHARQYVRMVLDRYYEYKARDGAGR